MTHYREPPNLTNDVFRGMFNVTDVDQQPQIAAKVLSLIWIVWGHYLLVLRLRKQSVRELA